MRGTINIIGAGLVVAALFSSPAFSATEAECSAAWTAADVKNQGTLTEADSPRFFAAMRVANKPIADGKISKEIFQENCMAGMFVNAKLDTGAPLSGANSFTEGQAKDRILAAGFANVSALKKDDKGVWRGTAMQAEKQVNVAVDFKGNVVAN